MAAFSTQPKFLAKFEQDTGVAPLADPLVHFAYESALLTRELLERESRGDRFVRDGVRGASVRINPPDLAGWKVGEILARDEAKVLKARYGKKGRNAAQHQQDLQDAFAGRVLPAKAPTRLAVPYADGFNYDQIVFIFTVQYLWRYSNRKPLSDRQLHELAFGLGIAPGYQFDDDGRIRIDHWTPYIRAAERVWYSAGQTEDVPTEAYWLATVAANFQRRTGLPASAMTGALLTDYIAEDQVDRMREPFAPRSGTVK